MKKDLETQVDIFFKLLSQHTKNITKINETNAIMEYSYNAWMEENMTNQNNDCNYKDGGI